MCEVIDMTGFVGVWPFREIPRSSREHLHSLAGQLGLERVVVSSFENLFRENWPDAAEETSRSIETDPLLVHFPIVNAAFPGALDDVKRLYEARPFPGIRLLGNYHGYPLDHPDVDALLAWTWEKGILVQVLRRIVDERLHYVLKVPCVPSDELVGLARRHPEQKLLYGALWFNEILQMAELTERAENVWYDVSRCRGPEFWPEQLIEAVSPERVVFGSLWPLQVIRSTLQEIRFAGFGNEIRDKILYGNAADLLGEA